MADLKLGYGEGVCFILNDLLNRQLAKKNFDFKTPIVLENRTDVYQTLPIYTEDVV